MANIDEAVRRFGELREKVWACERTGEMVERFKRQCTGTSRTFENDKVSGGASNAMELRLLRYTTAQQQYEEQWAEMQDEYKYLSSVIGRIADFPRRETLTQRYLLCLSWQEIADNMHFSVSWVHRLHIQGLQKAQEIMNKDGANA